MKRIHFIGIGGIGMSALAEIALNLSFSVSGSDLVENKITNRLKALGAKIYRGHSPINIEKSDTIVVSSAIPEDNPEILEAKKRGLNILKRGRFLAFLMEKMYGIAVVGAHGKTTTTGLIGAILNKASFSPTVINGGIAKESGSNAKLGASKYLICEADESDGSFLHLSPRISVVTNMDREHMEYFKNIGRMKREYLGFIEKADFAVLCSDNRLIREIIPSLKTKYKTYGIKQGEIRARNINILKDHTEFEVIDGNKTKGRWKVPLLGRHNVLNSLAALCVGEYLSIPIETIKSALETFSGIERRLDIKRNDEIMVLEDYGHHPTEIKETLKAAKLGWKRRLVVIFQPHRYTRTKDLLNKFAGCFRLADILILTDIYPASEKPIPNITGELLYSKINHPNSYYVSDWTKIPEFLKTIVKKGDIVLVLGAGDINKIIEPLSMLSDIP
ncbi:MAG: UDP-N-acetylmuramate--L-alanine ligase [bacterium]